MAGKLIYHLIVEPVGRGIDSREILRCRDCLADDIEVCGIVITGLLRIQ